ncbi:hypothetical protein COL940_012252 [Colletotrichum noveboracense]|nr:hypothetical protein COL940_012252 [Colletotrichum noveboracense]
MTLHTLTQLPSVGFAHRCSVSGLSTWIRQHSLPSRCFSSASESATARNLRRRPLASDARNGAAGIATMPFQQLRTGTASAYAIIAARLAADRKYGHVCIRCACPAESRSANVS